MFRVGMTGFIIIIIIPYMLSFFTTRTTESTAVTTASGLTCNPSLVLLLFPHDTKLELQLTTLTF